ncbi:DUF3953 domain-containing protein [Bacillus sp. AFS053548]|uniref:DUF3953 domain-containing protein n=1 Tax=Bacillus sp. AFS053548 TaxID=2033505 RepID=UPI000BFE1931|nr:hypothetical protein CN946_22740 [Bacillus sp. AFS053548]
MLKILRMIFILTVLILSIFGLITYKTVLLPYMHFFLAGLFLVACILEFKQKQKKLGYIYIIVSMIGFIVSMQEFIYN